jgi:hypothetical protein
MQSGGNGLLNAEVAEHAEARRGGAGRAVPVQGDGEGGEYH